MTSFLDLPYELYMKIFELSSVQDVVSLLQISREAYSVITDESMWKMFCTRYGVTSLASFQPRSTFRKVYTGLLHTYGPLIGLWASDHSSTGSIIQFRYWRNGIIGETWRFRGISSGHLETQEMERSPQEPCFYPFVFIALALDVVGRIRFPYICDPQKTVRIYWRIGPRPFEPNLQSYGNPTPSMHLLSPIHQARGTLHHPLPDFPPATNDPCYDARPGYPRLPEEPSIPYHNLSAVLDDNFTNSLVGAPSGLLKPRAISFFYPLCGFGTQDYCMSFYTPDYYGTADERQSSADVLDPMDSYRRICPRYYPLSYPKPPIDSSHFRLDILDGLWLSPCDTHGTRVLLLTYLHDRGMVRALGITGDGEVPRGAIVWTLNVDLEGSLDQEERQLFGEVQPGWKIFAGTAAGSGLFYLTERPLKGVITSLDEIRLRIGSTSYISRCCRFR